MRATETLTEFPLLHVNLFCLNFSVTRKVAQYLGEVLDDQRDKLQENLLANGGKVVL